MPFGPEDFDDDEYEPTPEEVIEFEVWETLGISPEEIVITEMSNGCYL